MRAKRHVTRMSDRHAWQWRELAWPRVVVGVRNASYTHIVFPDFQNQKYRVIIKTQPNVMRSMTKLPNPPIQTSPILCKTVDNVIAGCFLLSKWLNAQCSFCTNNSHFTIKLLSDSL